MNWNLFDFIIMGALLFGAGLMIDFAMRRMGKYRIPGVILIVLVSLYIWAELAVGIFTNLGS